MEELLEKIRNALANAESLTLEELEAIQSEARQYLRSLPQDKRGAFYWNSGLECLSMLISALKA